MHDNESSNVNPVCSCWCFSLFLVETADSVDDRLICSELEDKSSGCAKKTYSNQKIKNILKLDLNIIFIKKSGINNGSASLSNNVYLIFG